MRCADRFPTRCAPRNLPGMVSRVRAADIHRISGDLVATFSNGKFTNYLSMPQEHNIIKGSSDYSPSKIAFLVGELDLRAP